MRLAVLIAGLVGLVLSLGVLLVSLLLPIVNGPRTSWAEAAWGIVPGAICAFVCFVITVVGLVLMLIAPKPAARRSGQSAAPDDD